MSTLTSQLDILQVKQNHNEIKKAMTIFCAKCKQKHPLKEFSLNTIEACTICEHAHPTKMCPSLPGPKAVYQETKQETEPTYFIGPKKPWKPRPQGTIQGMHQDPSLYFNMYSQPAQHPTWQGSQQYQYPTPQFPQQA